MQDHVTGVVSNDGVRVRCTVVEKLYYCFCRMFGAFALCCSDFVEGYEHCAVDGSCVVEESAHDFLNSIDVGWWKSRGFVDRSGCLRYGAAVGGWNPIMRCMLRMCWIGVLEFVESSFVISRHGYVDDALCIIPFEGETHVSTRMYVAFLCLGTSWRWIKNKVSVPVGIVELGPKPWKSRPVSSVLDPAQCLPSLHRINSRKSAMVPVSGLMAVPWKA